MILDAAVRVGHLLLDQCRRRRAASQPKATYICDSCGEEIVVPVDISAGSHQDYIEHCPVCCHRMTLHVDIDSDGEARFEGKHE